MQKKKNNLKMIMEFDGWECPHFLMLPEVFSDKYMAYLSGAEVKILIYLFRRTLGFGRREDDISISQMANGLKAENGTIFDHGTGLSKDTVVQAIKSLIKKNMIEKVKNKNKKYGNLPSTYKVKMQKNQTELPLVG